MARNPLMRTGSPHRNETVDFSVSKQMTIGPLLQEALAAKSNALIELVANTSYQHWGLPGLRVAVASHLEAACGLSTNPEQVLITSGSQQAIWLIGQLYAPHGERIVLENPTYAGAIDAFRMLRARIEPLPVTRDGFVLDELETIFCKTRPRLLLLSPTCQAPTGVVMPEDQRARLVKLIDEHQITTVDDQTMVDLYVGPQRPTSLAELSSTAPIFTIGSLSKLFWPGLRVGWIRAPEPIINHLARLKAVVDMGGSTLAQLVAMHLLERSEPIRAQRHHEITHSLDLLCETMRQLLPDWSWRRPAGGLSFWAELPGGRATEFAQVALLHGVIIVAGSALTSDGSGDDHIRLQFVQDDESITLGVRRLAQAWQSYKHQGLR
jgi:DNA-binding transcriptional MocR family regulator